MNIAEKIGFFSRIIQTEAKDEKDRILNETKAELTAAKSKAAKEAQRSADLWIEEEKARVSQANNKEKARVSAETKKELAELRTKLAEEALGELEARLRRHSVSDEYAEQLPRKIIAALGGRQNARVIVMERDRAFVEGALPAGAALASVDGDFIGGFKLYLTDNNAIIDRTYAGGLKDERDNFSLRALVYSSHDTEVN